MAPFTISKEQETHIESLVAHYEQHKSLYRAYLIALQGHIGEAIGPESLNPLSKLVHSFRFRLKEPSSLKDKLVRKLEECEREHVRFRYTVDNLFTEINDLAGYRILHLHTRQIEEIERNLRPVLEMAHKIVEGPVAKTWDAETRDYYKSLNIATEENPRMYSSVHYVVQPNSRPPLVTIEIQVRTLADELWGEIDHKLNYPHEHKSAACREEILALARVTSGCSRLVDAIVTTHQEWERGQAGRVQVSSPIAEKAAATSGELGTDAQSSK
jgi:putative GTP pyrophosphokinase